MILGRDFRGALKKHQFYTVDLLIFNRLNLQSYSKKSLFAMSSDRT